MTSPVKYLVLVSVVLAVASAVLFSLFSTELYRVFSVRSDEDLRATFNEHRSSFEGLERLFSSNPDLYLATPTTFDRFNRPEDNSTSEASDSVRNIFQLAGILKGRRGRVVDLNLVFFPTSAITIDPDLFETSVEEKGLVYVLEEDQKVQQLLGSGRKYGDTAFRLIGKNWYIYDRIVVIKPE